MPATDRFRIALNPKLAGKRDTPESLDYVEVVAFRAGEVDQLWRVEVENLVDLFVIDPTEAVINMICDLRDGIAVILPGDYSALDLILLEFRMPFKNQPRKSNNPNTFVAKFIPTQQRLRPRPKSVLSPWRVLSRRAPI
jgi:hypothetical protein